jgi:penicillin-binding protein 2
MFRRRIDFLSLIFLCLFTLLVMRMGYIQILKGPDLTRQAVAMRSRQIELKEFSRGEILDRNLVPLTGTRVASAVYCLPQEIIKTYAGNQRANDQAAAKEAALYQLAGELGKLIGVEQEEIFSPLRDAYRRQTRFVRIADDLNPAEVQLIQESKLPGTVVAPVIKRYREDGFAVHLVGYLGGGPEDAGQAGLEKAYDALLRDNRSSAQLSSVLDARGVAIEGLMLRVRQQQNEQKAALVLSLDKRVQEIAEQAMDNHIGRGAVVVMDVDSKEVLAMVSRPAFNPYTVKEILASDQNGSLNNRTLLTYHPGSLFKILVAAAALEEGIIDENSWKYDCSGEYQFEQVSISCWKEEGHGPVNFEQAFALSCNPAFIKVGLELGRERLMEYARRLHATDESLLGYPSYRAGGYVTIDRGEPALGNACVGQQGVMLTPLQLASLVSTIADQGRWGPPRVLRYTVDSKGKEQPLPPVKKETVISPQTARRMQQLMEGVVAGGTGRSAALPQVRVAGKTGTSQTGRYRDQEKQDEVLNAWFAGYFPADQPRWAIVVVAEEGTSGAENAAPVFRAIANEMLRCFSTTSVGRG